MTPLEIYVAFVAPLLILLTVGAVVLITGWQDKRDARRKHAAE